MQRIVQTVAEAIGHRRRIFFFVIASEMLVGASILFFPWQYALLFFFLSPLCLFLLLRPFYAYLLGILLFPFWTITLTGKPQEAGFDLRWADAAFIIAAMGWLYNGLSNKKVSFKTTPLDFSIFLLFFWIGLSFFWSRNMEVSTYEFTKKLYAILVFYLTVNFVKTRQDFEVVLKIWVISGVIAALFGMYEMYAEAFPKVTGQLIPDRGVWGLRSTGFFLTPNKLGFFLSLSIMLGLCQYATTDSVLGRKFFLVSVFVMLIALVSTLSRTTYVTFISGALIMFLFSKGARKALTVCFVVGLIAFFLLTPSLYLGVLLRRIEAFIEPSIARDYYIRADIIRVTWEIFKDHPFAGVGIGNFAMYATAYKALRLDIPHNVYLYFLAEFGLVGFGLFLFWAGSLVCLCVRGLKRLWGKEERVVILSLLVGVIIFFLEAIVISFTFREIDVWCFVGLTVAGVQLFALSPGKLPSRVREPYVSLRQAIPHS
jgi:O-antigen ligase